MSKGSRNRTKDHQAFRRNFAKIRWSHQPTLIERLRVLDTDGVMLKEDETAMLYRCSKGHRWLAVITKGKTICSPPS